MARPLSAPALPPAAPLRLRPDWPFAAAVTLLFGLLALWKLYHHELWHDEAEPFLLARDSRTYAELLYLKRYEGHPNFWYTLLYGLTRFTHRPEAMQLLHLLFAAGFVFVFAALAPFQRLLRGLFCFGYFAVFEFSSLSRIYAPGLLFIFLLCALYPYRLRHPLRFGLLLFLCAQTSFFGSLFTFGFLGLAVLDGLNAKPLRPRQQALAYGVIFGTGLLGLLLAYLSSKPPPDSFLSIGFIYPISIPNAGAALATCWKSFLPLPQLQLQLHFWNTNLLAPWPYLLVLLSVGLYAVSAFSLWSRPRVLALYLGLTGCMLLFFYTVYLGYLRHHAHFFLAYLVCGWLAAQRKEQPSGKKGWAATADKLRARLLMLCLAVQVVAGAYAVYQDLRHPFAPGQEMAAYIRQLPGGYVLAATHEYECTPVSAYLDRPLYYTSLRRFGSFFVMDRNHPHLPPAAHLAEAQRLALARQQPVLLISTEQLPEELNGAAEWLFSTQPDVIHEPRLHLYRLSTSQIKTKE